MQFTKNITTQTLEVKHSKFIAWLFPYNEFGNVMKKLQKEHPKARHFVYAYRYLNEFSQVVENSSDDGEPKGTSGKPTLNVLAGNDLINCGIITVRYFGGIKLGTGGLVKAYSDAANLVISHSEFETYIKLTKKHLHTNYSLLSQIEYLITQLDITISHKEFTHEVILTLEASKEKFEELEKQLFLECELKDAS